MRVKMGKLPRMFKHFKHFTSLLFLSTAAWGQAASNSLLVSQTYSDGYHRFEVTEQRGVCFEVSFALYYGVNSEYDAPLEMCPWNEDGSVLKGQGSLDFPYEDGVTCSYPVTAKFISNGNGSWLVQATYPHGLQLSKRREDACLAQGTDSFVGERPFQPEQ